MKRSTLSDKTYYVDSNVFISPLTSDSSQRSTSSKSVLAAIEDGSVLAYTSTLTWDEVVWVARRLLGRQDAVQSGEKLITFPNLRFVPVSEDVVRSAQRLMSEYGATPRGSIHVASALSRDATALLSDDAGFDAIPVIRRVSSEQFRRGVR